MNDTISSDVVHILQTRLPDAHEVDAGAQTHFVLLSGLPGSGKSTFAHQLADRINAAVLSSDVCRFALVRKPTYSPEESERLFTAMRIAARILLTTGMNVIVDATNTSTASRLPFERLAHTIKSKLHVVHVTADEKDILDRLALRKHPRIAVMTHMSEADETIYFKMKERFSPPESPGVTVVNTSDPESVEKALVELTSVILS